MFVRTLFVRAGHASVSSARAVATRAPSGSAMVEAELLSLTAVAEGSVAAVVWAALMTAGAIVDVALATGALDDEVAALGRSVEPRDSRRTRSPGRRRGSRCPLRSKRRRGGC